MQRISRGLGASLRASATSSPSAGGPPPLHRRSSSIALEPGERLRRRNRSYDSGLEELLASNGSILLKEKPSRGMRRVGSEIPVLTARLKSLDARRYSVKGLEISRHSAAPAGMAHRFGAEEQEIAEIQARCNELIRLGDLYGAKEQAELCKDKVEGFFGPEHPVYASALNNLGFVYKQLQNYDKAVESLSGAAKIYREVFGPDHRHTITVVGNLAQLYKFKAQNDAKAMEKHMLLENSKTMYETVLNALEKEEENKSTVNYALFLQSYGSILRMQGRVADGSEKVEQGLRIIEERGEKDEHFAKALNNHGYDLKMKGHFEKAEQVYNRALFIAKEIFGETHQETLLLMHNLAELYIAWDRNEDANKIQTEILGHIEQHDQA